MTKTTKWSGPEVGDIFRQIGSDYRSKHDLPLHQLKAMNALEKCRSAALGGHKEKCDNDKCGHERISYNSCRNRHCPKCQFMAKEKWLINRKRDLLPISYFHIVFTIPDDLKAIALINQRVVYNIMFKSASETLLQLGRDPRHLGAEIGFLTVLHTWGQNLMDHPHLHCIVTGGGLSKDGERWIYPKKISKNRDFFVHINIISDLFKKKFIAYLKEAYQEGQIKCIGKTSHLSDPKSFAQLCNTLYEKKWNSYCKESFGGPEQVINYLGRYTHRVAISNHRIMSISDNAVTIKWKDYKDENKNKLLTLTADEFVRRFLLHILPRGYFKIRYYGILSNRSHKTKLKKCKEILKVLDKPDEEKHTTINWLELFFELTGIDLRVCPKCGIGYMKSIGLINPDKHAPP